MAAIRDYKDLRVYQMAFESAAFLYKTSQTFPREELYSLTDQMRRSSRSVCANLAEAWRKRRYPSSFVSKLSDADAESAETRVWLDFAFESGFLLADDHKLLVDRYRHIEAQLTAMMNRPEQWCASIQMKSRPSK